MTDTASRVPQTRSEYDELLRRTGRAGWVVAAAMLIVVGTFQTVEALASLFSDTYYVVGQDDVLVRVAYTGWTWINLVIGALFVFAGVGLLSTAMWARVVGVTLAAVGAVANLAFVTAYPFWSITVSALDVHH